MTEETLKSGQVLCAHMPFFTGPVINGDWLKITAY